MTYCQSITQILRIIWVRCIPLSLRSKSRRRATTLLPSWIYSCRSRVTVRCALLLTTNMTISTSISQTFRSLVAIFQPRQRMVFLYHSSYCMPGLAPLMIGRHGFHLSSSAKDMSLNVWNRPSGSLMVDMGSHQTLWSLSLPNVTWHSGTWPCTMAPSIDQTFHQLITELDFITDFDLITNFLRFP